MVKARHSSLTNITQDQNTINYIIANIFGDCSTSYLASEVLYSTISISFIRVSDTIGLVTLNTINNVLILLVTFAFNNTNHVESSQSS